MKPVHCPHCHQVIGTFRFGVRLPVLKAAILDKIRAAGDLGISSEELARSELYLDRRQVHLAAIKSHVNQINDLLTSTDWYIASDRRRWFLSRKRTL
jgi:hypothetical protein